MQNINPFILSCTKGLLKLDDGRKFFPNREAQWYELMLITEGEGYLINDGVRIDAKPGMVVLRHPGMVTRVYPPYIRYIILFDLNYDILHESFYETYKAPVDTFVKSKRPKSTFIDMDFSTSFVTDNIDLYSSIFEEIYQAYLKYGINNQIYMKARLLYLLVHIFEEKENLPDKMESKSITENRVRIQHLKKFMIDNITEDYTLHALAREVDLSDEFLCRIFKKIEKQTITQFINSQRLIKAKSELIETDKTIDEIAGLCGFQTTNYFYKLFKKHEKTTPQKYRIFNKY